MTKDRTFLSFDRNGDFYRREEELGNGSSFAPDPLDSPGFVSTLSLLHKLFSFGPKPGLGKNWW